jgi:hypothetical protein
MASLSRPAVASGARAVQVHGRHRAGRGATGAAHVLQRSERQGRGSRNRRNLFVMRSTGETLLCRLKCKA